MKDSIYHSLKEIKKTLKRGKKRGPKSTTRAHDNPQCDSNKTKATVSESPNANLPMEPELIISLFETKLCEDEK